MLITKEQWYQIQANSSVSVPKQLSVDDIPLNNTAHEDNEPASAEEPNYFGSAVNNANYDVEE